MSKSTKKINIARDVLLEYTYDDTNFKSNDYKVLINLKEKNRSYLSSTGLNVEENNLLLLDSVNRKYSNVNLTNFNFLRLQNYASSLILHDKITLYFTSSFDFYSDQEGFFLNVYTHGYDNETKYSLTNFYYTSDNINPYNIFTLSKPFFHNGVYWVKAIEIEIPSVYYVSNQRVVTNSQNVPEKNSLNENLSYGEGLSVNSPIFIEYAFISTKQNVLGIPYYYIGDLYKATLPQSPDFEDIGVDVLESTQGDYFEIYGTYLGSNENLDNFVYNETIKGNKIELNYIISLYEENILTHKQTIEITENFSQKILYRPIIMFSNTTAAIDVELRILNKVDSSYVSRFGSIGITNSINKYGRTLSRINLDNNVIKTDIFNLKYKNVIGQGSNGLLGINGSVISYNNNYSNNMNGSVNLTQTQQVTTQVTTPKSFDIVKVPYPVMYDKYNILVNSNNATTNTDYYSNGLLDIIITSFDNIINFNIAKDINSNGVPTPYDLSEITNNSKLTLVFKSDTDKVEKDIFNDAENYFQYGIIYFKIESNDYTKLKKMYNAGYDNFYIIISSDTSETQFFSGKFVFYEDVSFVNTSTSSTSSQNPTLTSILDLLKQQQNKDDVYLSSPSTPTDIDAEKDKTNISNYFNEIEPITIPIDNSSFTNLIVYVRFQTNQDLFDKWLKDNNITPKYKYSSMYFLERIPKTMLNTITSTNLSFIETTFEVPLNTGIK